jgi:hypothetical protein
MISTTQAHAGETITLDAVKDQFDQWRKLRTNRCRIPQYLWDGVRQLTQNYSYSQISSKLRISYQQISAHVEEQEEASTDTTPSDFPFVNAHIPLASATLEIQGTNGLNLKATGIGPQELSAIVQTLFRS